MTVKDLSGMRFGKLTVKSRSFIRKSKKALWLCQCDCGTEKVIISTSLTSGNSKSCGCGRFGGKITKILKHGHSCKGDVSITYKTWVGMITRCQNESSDNYSNYGGRGISICDRWRVFENFLLDMGERPSKKHTIDRIDFNGDYEPLNCRWATGKEQARNRRGNRIINTSRGRMCIADAAELYGISRKLISNRLRSGWSEFESLNIPVGGKR